MQGGGACFIFGSINKLVLFLKRNCIYSATVPQQGVVCPLTPQLTSRIASLTIIAYIPCDTMLLHSLFAAGAASIPLVYSKTWLIEYAVQRGIAKVTLGSPVATQVSYLWPPATAMSLFHGWQKKCQSCSSSGDLWPAAARAAHDPHSWVSDVGSL